MSSVLPPRVFGLLLSHFGVQKYIYLSDISAWPTLPDSTASLGRPRNLCRFMVERGHAGLECFTNNEFDPQDWRFGQVPQAEAGLRQEGGRKKAGQGSKRGMGLAEWADGSHLCLTESPYSNNRLNMPNLFAKKLMELGLARISQLFSLGKSCIGFGGPFAKRFKSNAFVVPGNGIFRI